MFGNPDYRYIIRSINSIKGNSPFLVKVTIETLFKTIGIFNISMKRIKQQLLIRIPIPSWCNTHFFREDSTEIFRIGKS